jgi:Protein of unknown function (DUF1822)
MKPSLHDLSILFPSQLWLSYPDTLYHHVLSCANQFYSNKTAAQTAILNQLCLKVLTDWIQKHLHTSAMPKVWPSNSDLPSIWEFVNGTALILGQNRLILIPSEALDTEEFSVPQEWVDIPSWVADYYLPIQVNLEDGWICVWGYATYQDLKQEGKYDPIYHTYSLERDWVISDLDLLWVRDEIKVWEPSFTHALPPLSPSNTERLIQKLSQISPYSPRLDREFEEWAALIEQPHFRQRLYHQRLQNASTATQNQVQASIINTGVWLQGKVDRLAQELSWILLPEISLEPSALRSPAQEITSILHQLKQSGLTIPDISRGAYQDIQLTEHALRLYAVTWSFVDPNSMPQWYLLLLLSAPMGARLPSGITLSVRDETRVLVEQTLAEMGHQQYVVAGVSGAWNETFQVSITLKNDASLTLPSFGFSPEQSL